MAWRRGYSYALSAFLWLLVFAIWFALYAAQAKPAWMASAEVRTGTAPCKMLVARKGGQAISWYHEGTHTADGKRFNPHLLTGAHPKWKFGTMVKVTMGDKSVTVRINDRGPAKWTGCTLDVSLGAAKVLGKKFLVEGVALAKIEVVKPLVKIANEKKSENRVK